MAESYWLKSLYFVCISNLQVLSLVKNSVALITILIFEHKNFSTASIQL
jgi:hypothetical protein